MKKCLVWFTFRGENRWNESRNDLGSSTVSRVRTRKKNRGLFIRKDPGVAYWHVTMSFRKPRMRSSMARKRKRKSLSSNVVSLKNANEHMNWRLKPINSKNWCIYLSQLRIWTRIRTAMVDSIRQKTTVSIRCLILTLYRFLLLSNLNKTKSSKATSASTRHRCRVRTTVPFFIFLSLSKSTLVSILFSRSLLLEGILRTLSHTLSRLAWVQMRIRILRREHEPPIFA